MNSMLIGSDTEAVSQIYPNYETDANYMEAKALYESLGTSATPQEDYEKIKELLTQMLSDYGVDKITDGVKANEAKNVNLSTDIAEGIWGYNTNDTYGGDDLIIPSFNIDENGEVVWTNNNDKGDIEKILQQLEDRIKQQMKEQLGDLYDEVPELVRLHELHGHAALAGAHADGQAADLVEVGRGQRDGLPRAGGERADAHVAEDDGINPADGRGGVFQFQTIAANAQGQLMRQHDAAERRAQIKGVTLGIQRRVRHLADAAHDNGVEGALGIEIGTAAALDGTVIAPDKGKAMIGIAHGADGAGGTDLFAHAAACAGLSNRGGLAHHKTGGRPLAFLAAAFARGAVDALPGKGDGVKGAGGHTGAAEGAAFRAVVHDPGQIVEADVVSLSCFHRCTSRLLSMTMVSRSPG